MGVFGRIFLRFYAHFTIDFVIKKNVRHTDGCDLTSRVEVGGVSNIQKRVCDCGLTFNGVA